MIFLISSETLLLYVLFCAYFPDTNLVGRVTLEKQSGSNGWGDVSMKTYERCSLKDWTSLTEISWLVFNRLTTITIHGVRKT